MPLLPKGPATPPADSSATFGPGAVAAVVGGQQRDDAKAKKKPKVKSKPLPVAPVAPVDQRDMSHSSPPPSPKVENPDLGAQPNTGAASPQIQQPMPSGPPIPALQRYGVNLGIQDVNQRVQDLTAAHLQQFGYKPSPGLIYDMLKAEGKTGPIGYSDLFGIPKSPQEAAAQLASRQGSGDSLATLPVVQPKPGDLVKALVASVAADKKAMVTLGATPDVQSGVYDENYRAFLRENQTYLQTAYEDPQERDQIVQGLMKAHQAVGNPAQFLAASVFFNPFNKPKDPFLPITQIADLTTNMPFGGYELVRAAGLDALDLSTIGLHLIAQNTGLARFGLDVGPRPAPLHLARMGERMAQQVVQDVLNPTSRPGYLLADVWGAYLGAAGVAGRAAEVARAEGVAAKLRAAAFKTPPQDTVAGFANYWQSLPLSDTVGVKLLQKYTPVVGREARQRRFAAEQTDGYDDLNQERMVDRLMPLSKTIARQRKKDMQIQMAIALTPLEEYNKLIRADSWAKEVFNETIGDWKNKSAKGISRKDRLGAEMALRLVLSDDVDPATMWRSFHERQIQRIVQEKSDAATAARDAAIENGDGLVTERNVSGVLENDKAFQRQQRDLEFQFQAHKSKLEAIQLAEGFLDNVPARFKPLIDRAHEVNALKEEWMKELTGIPDDLLNQAIAKQAGFARGDQMIDLGDGYLGYSDEDPEPLLKAIEARNKKLAKVQEKLRGAEGSIRLHPDRSDFVEKAETLQKLVNGHKKALGKYEQQLQAIKDKATPVRQGITPENDYGGVPPTEGAAKIRALREGTPGSGHIGMQTERHRGDEQRGFTSTRSRFGIRPNKFTINPFTGDSIRVGDYRLDVSNLLNEQIPLVYRAFTQRQQYEYLWKNGVDTPITDRHMPIRDIASIPEDLRRFVTAIERSKMDPRYADMLTDGKFDELRKFLYPTNEEIRNGEIKQEHIKYVDRNLVLDNVGPINTKSWQDLDKIMSAAFAPINDPMRLFLIYGTPAYALNALGSAALLLIHSGFMAPVHFMRALRAEQIYGPEVKRVLDRLAGQTHTASLETERVWWSPLSKGNQKLQEGWSLLTDTWFRRAAVINELKRHGLLDEKMENSEILDALSDERNARKVNQAAQTARKAMLDFNSLSWPERAIMRHLIFVYSFIRASGIWSLRYMRDHGFQADVLGQAGANREQNINDLIGHMPEWFMRAGYFAVKPDAIVNPIQWNMPGMLSQILEPVASIFHHVPYSSAAELWGPGTVFATETATGVNPQGQALTHGVPGLGEGNLSKAMYQLYQQTFLGQIATKQAKAAKEKPLKPEGISVPETHAGGEEFPENPIGPALQHEASGLNQSVFDQNGFWNQWGLALFRSGITRNVNPVAGEARYWRDLRNRDPKAFHRHELDAVVQMLKRQQQVVGAPASSEVIQAVEMVSHVSQAIYDWQQKHKGELNGVQPSQKQLAQITLDTLVTEGKIKNKAEWAQKIKEETDPAMVKALRIDLLIAGGGDAWRKWVSRVDAIDAYAQPKFDATVQSLNNFGLGDYTAASKTDRAVKWAYGRRAQPILDQAHALAAKVAPLSGDEAKIAQQDWIRFVNDNDKPITVKGVTFPSPFSYQFAAATPDQQVKSAAVLTKRAPSTLTAFQSELLTGVRPEPVVTHDWEQLSTWLQQQRAKLPFGTRLKPTVDKQGHRISLRQFYGDFLAERDPAFKEAWDFERQPLAKRMLTYDPITNSQHAKAWNWLLSSVADKYDQYAVAYLNKETGKVNQALVKEAWKEFTPSVIDQIKSRYPNGGFLSELRVYTGATSDATADAYLEKFLDRLISP